MFNVFVLSFKTFISSVYSVTGIAMPLSILGISWSFISSIYSMCVCVCVCMYIYIYNKYRFRHRLGTGTVLKVSIWHRYRKKPKRYPTLVRTPSPRQPSGKDHWNQLSPYNLTLQQLELNCCVVWPEEKWPPD